MTSHAHKPSTRRTAASPADETAARQTAARGARGTLARRAARLASALTFALLLLPSSPNARAQSASATLTGTVSDEAGAVVPGVRVTVLNLSTALQRHATTNEEGAFVVALLPPGRYHLTARREGFSTFEVRHITLNVNDQQALRIRLRVGEIGETVTVFDSLPGVQETTSVSTVVDRHFVEHLPLNGRSFHSLFELTPGAVLTRASFNEQGQFSVNGQRANANYFTVDGVSANIGVSAGAAPGQAAGGSLPALTVLGGTNNLVSVDALEEFRVQTSAYAPEFGRTSGAQVSIVTRSGGNVLRGSVFNYFRHESLDANDWFANSRGLARPRIRQHDFGGTVGGPIRRDRAFFFVSHESLRLEQPQVAVTEVPSLATRQSAPVSLRPLLDAFPLPNGAETANGFAEFAATYSDPSRVDSTSLRFDGVVTDKLTVFARYSRAPSETHQRGLSVRPAFGQHGAVNPVLALSLNTLSRTALDTETLTGGFNLSLGPQVVNELRANWSRARGATSFALDTFGGARVPTQALLFPAPAHGARDSAFQFALQGGANSNLVAGGNAENLQRQLNVVNNLSAARGSHQWKFGADFRRLTPVYSSLAYGQSVVYGGVGTPGNAPAGTLLSGRALSVQVFAGAGPRFPVFTNFSAYAQDTWRATRRLTLTYGLRWELNPPPSASRGRDALALINLDERGDRLAPAPRGTPLWRTTYNNFAPRLGFALLLGDEPGRELVLRGGGGIFYDLGTGQAAQGYGNVAPFVAANTFANVEFPLAPDLAAPPALTDEPPFGTVVAFDPELRLPRAYQWNLALARSFGVGQTLTAAYVGALGRDLLREDAFLQPNVNFGVVRVTTNGARSSYHALQVQFARRLARSVQALASYTFARSVDDASSDALSRIRPTGGVVVGNLPGIGASRGPSDFDVRHSLTAAASYTLPSLARGGPLAPLVRGWSVDAVLRARTATPVNVVTQTEVFGEGLVVELRRPDLVEGVPVYVEDRDAPGGRRLNREAFRVPADNRQGTLGYNALRGFPLAQLDASLRRQINLNERLRLDLRAEVFNLFNRANFGNPVSNLSSNQFGRSTQTFARSLGTGGASGGLSPIYQVGGPRSVQLALKLHF